MFVRLASGTARWRDHHGAAHSVHTEAIPISVGDNLGTVGALWRYPVKSMLGEELNATALGKRGLVGDRVYAIIDPDGRVTNSDDGDFNDAISAMLGRAGQLQSAVPEQPVLEEYWPDIEGLDLRDEVTDESLPDGTFFDLATIHVLTTATLDRLRQVYPEGRFEVRRFRPNIVVQTPAGETSFLENGWADRTLVIGDEVRLKITGDCPRCVMTTLPQADLPRDPGILRAAAQHNDAHVGIYAEVEHGGRIRRGDAVRVE